MPRSVPCVLVLFFVITISGNAFKTRLRSAASGQSAVRYTVSNRRPSWSDLGVTYHSFIGEWHNMTYQARIWLRIACTDNPDVWEGNFLISLNSAPLMNWNFLGQLDVPPKQLLVNGKLPGITLEPATLQCTSRRMSSGTADSMCVVQVLTEYWDSLIQSESKSTVFSGKVAMKAKVIYHMRMQGSERTYQLNKRHCSKPHKELFPPGNVYIGMAESVVPDRNTTIYAFLIDQHLKYHSKLGFDGMVLAVLRGTYQLLIQEPLVMNAITEGKLILLKWEWWYVQSKTLFIQIPSHNLIRMVMRHTGARLGFWDLDEYLVISSRRSIKEQLAPGGCLSSLGNPEPDLVIPFSLVNARKNNKPNELNAWMAYGSWPAAVREMDYTMQPLKHCNHGIYCKSFVDVDSDHAMHVHQLLVPPPATHIHTMLNRSCMHMLHFWSMWTHRGDWFWDPENLEELVPLNLSAIQLG